MCQAVVALCPQLKVRLSPQQVVHGSHGQCPALHKLGRVLAALSGVWHLGQAGEGALHRLALAVEQQGAPQLAHLAAWDQLGSSIAQRVF